MRRSKATSAMVMAITATFLLVGCESLSGLLPDHGRDYKRSRTERALEVPPGLTTSSIQDTMPVPGLESGPGVRYSDYNRPLAEGGSTADVAGSTGADASGDGVPQMKLAADQTGNPTLLVRADFERTWKLTARALADRGIVIDDEDRRRGVYRVRWADPVREGPAKEGLLDSLKFWGDPDEVEPVEEKIYQVAMKGSKGVTRIVLFDEDDTRDRTDSGARLLARLKKGIQSVSQPGGRVAFGGEGGAVAKVVNDSRGQPQLLIAQQLSVAWEGMARALIRTGFSVAEANRTRGVYSVRYDGPAALEDQSLLERINVFGDDQPNYLIAMRGDDVETRAVVFDTDGERETSPVGLEILALLRGAFVAEQARELRSARDRSGAAPAARVEQDADGYARMLITDGFAQAWRLTGLALDQAGFSVEDRDRGRGVYSVRYKGPSAGEEQDSFFSRWFADDGDAKRKINYQIALKEVDADTLVVVFDDQGNRDESPVAEQILKILAERIN